MRCTRRDFFFGRWINSQQKKEEGNSVQPVRRLPSDFSPALLKMQAKQLGLDIEHSTQEEIEKIVLDTLYAQKPSNNPNVNI